MGKCPETGLCLAESLNVYVEFCFKKPNDFFFECLFEERESIIIVPRTSIVNKKARAQRKL